MRKGSAATITLAALALGLVLAAASAIFLMSLPWLGVALTPDLPAASVRLTGTAADGPARALPRGTVTAIRAGGGEALAIEAEDLVEEPDFFDSYARLARFLDRQTLLHAALKQGAVEFEIESAGERRWSAAVEPGRRPIGDLSPGFWIQIVVGMASLVIGAWVWSLRPAQTSTRLFALAGAMIMGAAYSAAIYSSRELAIDGGTFRLLSALNHASTFIFGMAMIAMFLCYPRRLVPPRVLWIIPAVFVPWLAADLLRLLPTQTLGIQLPVLVEMLLILAIVCVQWFINRNDPHASAALRWLGLSVVVGAGAFVSVVIAPILFDSAPAMQQSYAFAFFLLIYVGLALGISRYRLFELDVWAFRILFYTAGAVLLLALDAVLVYVVAVDRAPAFGIALLLVAFLYLPLRDMLGRRFASRRTLDRHTLLRAVVDVGFGPSGEARAARWRGLLGQLFDPLECVGADEPVAGPAIRQEGLELAVPAAAGAPALTLRRPWGGRGLFRPDDVETSREAYERGAVEERRRIAADLHDDVGARLLSGLHHHEVREIKDVLRKAMADVRTIAVGLAGDRMPLGTVLADLRHEAGQRLERTGIDLTWTEEHAETDEPFLDYPVYKNLVSAHRELVSNAIRHAGASRIDFTITRGNGILRLVFADDGEGFGPALENGRGSGLANVRRRIAALDGSLVLGASEGGGARIELALPLGKTAS
jgi:signal transduction histidine kinase